MVNLEKFKQMRSNVLETTFLAPSDLLAFKAKTIVVVSFLSTVRDPQTETNEAKKQQ